MHCKLAPPPRCTGRWRATTGAASSTGRRPRRWRPRWWTRSCAPRGTLSPRPSRARPCTAPLVRPRAAHGSVMSTRLQTGTACIGCGSPCAAPSSRARAHSRVGARALQVSLRNLQASLRRGSKGWRSHGVRSLLAQPYCLYAGLLEISHVFLEERTHPRGGAATGVRSSLAQPGAGERRHTK